MSKAAMERMNYYSDPRVIASMRTRYYEVRSIVGDKAIVKLTEWFVELLDEDDDPPVWFKPGSDHVYFASADRHECGMCRGKGTTVNPSIDCGGISSDDEFWEDDYDYDTGESRYMRGDYDVQCAECSGTGLFQSVFIIDDGLRAWICEMEKEEWEYQQERLAELRFGC